MFSRSSFIWCLPVQVILDEHTNAKVRRVSVCCVFYIFDNNFDVEMFTHISFIAQKLLLIRIIIKNGNALEKLAWPEVTLEHKAVAV